MRLPDNFSVSRVLYIMEIEITRSAQKTAATLYKEYLERVRNGSSKTLAREFSDEELTALFADEHPEDAYQTRNELIQTFSMKTNILGDLFLSDKFIAHMENRYKNGLKEVLSFLSQFIP